MDPRHPEPASPRGSGAREAAYRLLRELGAGRQRRLDELGSARALALPEAALAALADELALLEAWMLRLAVPLRRTGWAPPDDAPSGRVRLGSRVSVLWDDGRVESCVVCHPIEERRFGSWSWVSHDSPLGRALLGRSAGDPADVAVGATRRSLLVLSVR
jgi:transcription elongation GreA/GreB family factor